MLLGLYRHGTLLLLLELLLELLPLLELLCLLELLRCLLMCQARGL